MIRCQYIDPRYNRRCTLQVGHSQAVYHEVGAEDPPEVKCVCGRSVVYGEICECGNVEIDDPPEVSPYREEGPVG